MDIDYLRVANGNEDLAELWKRHVAKPTDQTVADLMAGYGWLVRSVVRKGLGMIYHQLGVAIDRDDLTSLANIGLLESIQRFDPTQDEAAFATFARTRMWGEVVDEMRRLSLVKRATYDRLKKADQLPRVNSFQSIGTGSSDPRRRWDDWADWEERFIAREHLAVEDDRKQTEEILEIVEKVLHSDQLDDRQRTVTELYYFVGVPLWEIGRRFGVTESRVSQMLKEVRKIMYEQVLEELPHMRPHAEYEVPYRSSRARRYDDITR